MLSFIYQIFGTKNVRIEVATKKLKHHKFKIELKDGYAGK